MIFETIGKTFKFCSFCGGALAFRCSDPIPDLLLLLLGPENKTISNGFLWSSKKSKTDMKSFDEGLLKKWYIFKNGYIYWVCKKNKWRGVRKAGSVHHHTPSLIWRADGEEGEMTANEVDVVVVDDEERARRRVRDWGGEENARQMFSFSLCFSSWLFAINVFHFWGSNIREKRGAQKWEEEEHNNISNGRSNRGNFSIFFSEGDIERTSTNNKPGKRQPTRVRVTEGEKKRMGKKFIKLERCWFVHCNFS